MTGFSLLALDLELGTAIVTFLTPVMVLVVVIGTWQRWPIHWRQVLFVGLGTWLGQPLGFWFLVRYKETDLARGIVGFIIFLYALHGYHQRRQVREKLPEWVGVVLGFVGGLTGGALASGGPPIVFYLYSRVDDAREMKGTIQLIFLLMQVQRLWLGQVVGSGYSLPLLWLCLIVIVPVVAVNVLGQWLSRHSKPVLFKRNVNLILAVFGGIVCLRSVFVMLRG
jgi:uncharacterized membrane protein YfcA